MATVEFSKLEKRYGLVEAVKSIDLSIEDGEFVVLVGPSGCGKSTSLRMLAGLEEISGGSILIDGRIVNEVEPRDRDIAMVFQDYALYPHMSVFDNMAFSLQYRGVRKAEIRERVLAAAEILGIESLLDRRPKALSGGQRQRVAMGRAIVRKPQVFLFDEPLSNLDAKLRGSMRLEMRKLHHRLGVTTVYVTHDQIEAMTLADRVVVMRGGHIEQVGTPEEVYSRPATLFVAGFMGSPTMNLLPAELSEDGSRLRLGDTGPTLPAPHLASRIQDKSVTIGLRSEDIEIGQGPSDGAAFEAVVDVVEPLGPDTLIFTTFAGQSCVARVKPGIRPTPGDTLSLTFNPQKAHVFDHEGRAVR